MFMWSSGKIIYIPLIEEEEEQCKFAGKPPPPQNYELHWLVLIEEQIVLYMEMKLMRQRIKKKKIKKWVRWRIYTVKSVVIKITINNLITDWKNELIRKISTSTDISDLMVHKAW